MSIHGNYLSAQPGTAAMTSSQFRQPPDAKAASSEVETEMHRLASACVVLRDAAQELARRLSPVSRPMPPMPISGEKVRAAMSCEVSSNLESNRIEIENITNGINSSIEALAI
jgi:hypothetical protein